MTMATSVEERTPLGLENPMGTDGFEFVEYAAPDCELLRDLFSKMGFPEVARHKRKNVTLHRQGDCNFIINSEPGSYAEDYAEAHGPSACAMAFRFKDAKKAHARALELGATDVKSDVGDGEMDIPAIEGIGGSRLYFVDRYGDRGKIYDIDFELHADWQEREREADSKLTYIDHLTHNVHRGNMAVWADFYERLFNFREIRYFDIEGKADRPVLKSDDRPMRQDPHPAQREPGRQEPDRGVPREYNGEGIQHIALGFIDDIYATVDILRERAEFRSRTRPTPITSCFPSGCPKGMARTSRSSRSATS
jgi:4-hydroxyphenylpyruvate dioxygenase